MGGTLHTMARFIFGDGLTTDLVGWMSSLFDTANNIWSGSAVSTLVSLLSAAACSLMVIYFFMDLMNQASKDMFSLEKLIIAFIRLLIAFAVLLFLKDIVEFALNLGEALMQTISDGGLNEAGGESFAPADTSAVKDAYDKKFNPITHIPMALACLVQLLIPFLISWACRLMGRFITASTIVLLIVRSIFAPLAVVQIFEEGTRSAGVKYIKSLIAEAMSFSVIIAILYLAQQVSVSLLKDANINLDDPNTLVEALDIDLLCKLIIPQLVSVGGMASGSKIAHEIMGG